MPTPNPPVIHFRFAYRTASYVGHVIHDGGEMGEVEVAPAFLANVPLAWTDPENYGIDYEIAEAYAYEAILRTVSVEECAR